MLEFGHLSKQLYLPSQKPISLGCRAEKSAANSLAKAQKAFSAAISSVIMESPDLQRLMYRRAIYYFKQFFSYPEARSYQDYAELERTYCQAKVMLAQIPVQDSDDEEETEAKASLIKDKQEELKADMNDAEEEYELFRHLISLAPNFASSGLDTRMIEQLLKLVVEGEQDQAEALIKKDPQLLLATGNIIDLSGRSFENITAFQYALWAMDYHMWTMIQKYLPVEVQAKQYTLLECKGTAHGRHYDIKPLFDALKVFIDNAEQWNYDQRAVEQWCKEVGRAQSLLPVHVVNEYCRPDRSFASYPIDWESELPRTKTVWVLQDSKWCSKNRYIEDSWYKLPLGSSLACCQWWGRPGVTSCWCGNVITWYILSATGIDYIALQALWHARTQQLKRLIYNLKQKSSLVKALQSAGLFSEGIRLVLDYADAYRNIATLPVDNDLTASSIQAPTTK